jgi:UDP-N-acetylglucosamine 2-epimerase (non-hydrolysing)
MKILHVVGARPNFMKVAPVMLAMSQHSVLFEQALIHTGQHYDPEMSQVFFEELGLPIPDDNLGVGSGSHASQTAQVMMRFEPVLLKYAPDFILVVGDVNSTLACALVGSKLGIRVGHVEAGLRSFDRTMPEEINRLLTDQIADLLFTHSPEATKNLIDEGVDPEKIYFVGNVMIDTLVRLLPLAKTHWPALRDRFGLDHFLLVTLHRPANVDQPQILQEILEALAEIQKEVQIIFPVHPRTHRIIAEHRLVVDDRVRLIPPLGYLDFLALQANAALVLTDSGGVQEETTYLGVPCLTARPNTERPVTITSGTNELVDSRREVLSSAIRRRLSQGRSDASPPPGWDGKAAERIVDVFMGL